MLLQANLNRPRHPIMRHCPTSNVHQDYFLSLNNDFIEFNYGS
nr:MAG TPA: hypothetical protein [Caudoviricetes sp.]